MSSAPRTASASTRKPFGVVPSSFVAVLCIFASVLGLANLLFFRLFCRKQTQVSLSPIREFRDWSMPRSMMLGLFAMLILSLILEIAEVPFAEGFGVTANVLLAIPLFLLLFGLLGGFSR